MKAVHYSENGGPEVMQYGEIDAPAVDDDTVLIRTEAISVEGGDLLNRLIAPPPRTPYVPGYQAGGIVEATGSKVTRFKPGDRVVGFHWGGSHAELFAVPHDHVYPVPDGLEIRDAAVVPVAFGTAHDAVVEYGRIQPGETILVQGAAGGVGLAAVQIAKEAGATVIGTAAGRDRLDRLGAFGLDHGIDYREENIGERCLEITDGKGVDLVVDLAGGKGKSALIDALRSHGRYAVVGASTGDAPSFGFFELMRKQMTVFGVLLGVELNTGRVHAMIADMFAKVQSGSYRMPIDSEFSLADAVEAHRHVAQGHPIARVIMRP